MGERRRSKEYRGRLVAGEREKRRGGKRGKT